MIRRKVRMFFGIFALLVGAVLVMHSMAFGTLTGSSVRDGDTENSLLLHSVIAERVGSFVDISFMVRSEQQYLRGAYVFEGTEVVQRSGEFDFINEPGETQKHRIRVAVPLEEVDPSIILSISDGNSFASQRAVMSRASRSEKYFSREVVSLVGLAALLCFVLGYVYMQSTHHRRVRVLGHHARNSLAFSSKNLR